MSFKMFQTQNVVQKKMQKDYLFLLTPKDFRCQRLEFQRGTWGLKEKKETTTSLRLHTNFRVLRVIAVIDFRVLRVIAVIDFRVLRVIAVIGSYQFFVLLRFTPNKNNERLFLTLET